jgi:DNA-binding response OmpR family regulator
MDIRMPVMDGLETTKRIREQASHTKQPVIIAVTAGVLQDKLEPLLRAGCDDIVIKPFKENDLFEMLQQHLKVKFIYESVAKPVESIDLNTEKLRLSPSDFYALPEEIVLQLKKSIAALKINAALDVIEEIREHNEPLADTLQKLVKEYRFDTLQKLLDHVEQP